MAEAWPDLVHRFAGDVDVERLEKDIRHPQGLADEGGWHLFRFEVELEAELDASLGGLWLEAV